ncbi:MAG: type I restriction enzyme HsdR N-terminal domain-containing protein [Burkholderiaceae bacterium]
MAASSVGRMVVFVNGLPLAVIELKAPGGENDAGRRLQSTPKPTGSRFRRCFAAMLCWFLLTACRRGWARCRRTRALMPWRTTDGMIEPKGMPEMATLGSRVCLSRGASSICCATSPCSVKPAAG